MRLGALLGRFRQPGCARSGVVGAQQRRFHLPPLFGQPTLDRFERCAIGSGTDGEFSHEDGSVAADGAGDVDGGFFGLATAAMMSGDDHAGDLRVEIQPGNGQVGALVSRFQSGSGLVPAARAGARCFSRRGGMFERGHCRISGGRLVSVDDEALASARCAVAWRRSIQCQGASDLEPRRHHTSVVGVLGA